MHKSLDEMAMRHINLEQRRAIDREQHIDRTNDLGNDLRKSVNQSACRTTRGYSNQT